MSAMIGTLVSGYVQLYRQGYNGHTPTIEQVARALPNIHPSNIAGIMESCDYPVRWESHPKIKQETVRPKSNAE